MRVFNFVAHSQGSLRGRLTLTIGGLTLLTLLAAGLYQGRLAVDMLGTSRSEVLQISAYSAAELLASQLRERETEIDLLSRSPLFTRDDLRGDDVREALELRRKAHPEFVWLGVADANGLVVQATSGLLIGTQVEHRPWFKLAQSGPHTGDPHDAPLLGAHLHKSLPGASPYLMDFAAPIFDEHGHLRGILASHSLWDWVSEQVESSVIERVSRQDVELLIADKAGRIIFPRRYTGQLQLPAQIQSGQVPRQITWENSGHFLVAAADVKHTDHGDLGWRIVLRQPARTALAPVLALREHMLWIGLGLAVLFTLVAYVLAVQLSRPIEALATLARDIESGQRRPLFPIWQGVREMVNLRNAMQSLMSSLLEREQELVTLNGDLERQVAERTMALSEANRELASLARRDGLTGLLNRRVFEDKLRESHLIMQRKGHVGTLLLIDADHFKRVNDEHGHPIGDEVLKALAQLLRHHTRATDTVTRYGGEEFAIFLPDSANEDEGRIVAENIRKAVSEAVFPGVGRMTVSIGVSRSSTADTSELNVLQRADLALYLAKANGRNRFMVAPINEVQVADATSSMPSSATL